MKKFEKVLQIYTYINIHIYKYTNSITMLRSEEPMAALTNTAIDNYDGTLFKEFRHNYL
jgi:hypothetical protein